MSKRKIISSLFLSATVLGGLLFTQAPTVRAIESEGVQIISPKSESAPIFLLENLFKRLTITTWSKSQYLLRIFRQIAIMSLHGK